MKTVNLSDRMADLYRESIARTTLPSWMRPRLDVLNRLLIGIEEKVQISVWISLCALIVSLIGNSCVQDQRDTLKDRRSKLDAFPLKLRNVLNEKDDAIRDLLRVAGPGPVILDSPANKTSLVANRVTLSWIDRREFHDHKYTFHDHNYTVEVVFPNGKTYKFLGTNSSEQKTSFPPDRKNTLNDSEYGPGLYLWRVVRADLENATEVAAWSGYYSFHIYNNHEERIRKSGCVRIGIHSDGVFGDKRERSYVGWNPRGGIEGDDAYRALSIVGELQNELQGKDYSKRIKPNFREYPTIDALLEDGVLSGEVDFAIGAITKTKYREGRGIVFTKSYEEAPVVAISRKGKKVISAGDKVGFVEGTIHRKAVKFLGGSVDIVPINELTYGGMRERLGNHALDVILMDKPRVDFEEDKEVDIIPGYDFKPFEIGELGYPAGYAIATSDAAFAHHLNAILDLLGNDRRSARAKDTQGQERDHSCDSVK